MKQKYINTLNFNSLFLLKRRSKTHHNTFVQKYPPLSFRYHLAIDPDYFHCCNEWFNFEVS